MRIVTPIDRIECDSPKSQSEPRPRESGAAYASIWQRLPDALKRVQEAAGTSKGNAQNDICRAIADGAIRIRGQLNKHARSHMTSRVVLEASAFQIPPELKPRHLDWDGSRPVKTWVVARGAYSLPGHWHLAWIELSRTDVTNILCGAKERSGPTQRTSDEPPMPGNSRPQLQGTIRPNPTASVGRSEPGAAGSARRRGPRATKLNATKNAMMEDIRQGRLTESDLKAMLEKTLAAKYGVSRDTARKARNEVLSEFSS